MDKVRSNEYKVDILFGHQCGDRLLWRFVVGGNVSEVSEGNFEIMGGSRKEERPLAHHGDIKRVFQGRDRREVAHVAISRHNGVSNISEEMGGDMFIGNSIRGRIVVGLGFTKRGSREADYPGFRGDNSRGIERVVGWRRGIDPGGCGNWR